MINTKSKIVGWCAILLMVVACAPITPLPGGGISMPPPPSSSGSSGGGASGGGGVAPGGGGKKRKEKHTVPKAPPALLAITSPYTKTTGKGGKSLCMGYQTGACSGHDGKECPHNKQLKHLCQWCLGTHSATACRRVTNTGGKGGKNT